jgi:hypothetical protein
MADVSPVAVAAEGTFFFFWLHLFFTTYNALLGGLLGWFYMARVCRRMRLSWPTSALSEQSWPTSALLQALVRAVLPSAAILWILDVMYVYILLGSIPSYPRDLLFFLLNPIIFPSCGAVTRFLSERFLPDRFLSERHSRSRGRAATLERWKLREPSLVGRLAQRSSGRTFVFAGCAALGAVCLVFVDQTEPISWIILFGCAAWGLADGYLTRLRLRKGAFGDADYELQELVAPLVARIRKGGRPGDPDRLFPGRIERVQHDVVSIQGEAPL